MFSGYGDGDPEYFGYLGNDIGIRRRLILITAECRHWFNPMRWIRGKNYWKMHYEYYKI